MAELILILMFLFVIYTILNGICRVIIMGVIGIPRLLMGK